MQIDWVNVINDGCTALVTVATLIGVNKKWPALFRAVVFVERNAGAIVQTAETLVKDVVATPIGAAVKHHLEAEVDKVTEQFKQSEIARLALVGLHSFNTTLNGLSDVQKVALAKFVVESVPAEWGVKQEDVLTVLADVQKAADAFAQLEIVKAANIFTDAQKSAIAAAAQPSTQTA